VLKTLLLFALFLCIVGIVAAQDEVWQPNADNSIEYNCTTLPIILSNIKAGDAKSLSSAGDMIIARTKDVKTITVNRYLASKVMALMAKDGTASITSADLFKDASTACNPKSDTTTSNTSTPVDEFNVVVKGNVNVRSCAGTKCSVVQNVKDGSLFTVIAVDGDWYEIKVDGGTAFILSSLTTRGPDDVIKVDEPYLDVPTGCYIVFDMKRGDMNVNFILSGKKQSDILVDIYRPKETRPLKVEAQLDKTFSDTNDPYIYQYYAYNVSWPSQGRYQLELTFNGKTRKLAWEFKTQGEYNIYVQCD
jgi:hypothetical protein